MLIALDLSAVKEFVSLYDSGDDKTVFKIGVLDSITRAKIEDKQTEFVLNRVSTSGHADMRINRRQRNIEIVKHGLRGWDKFKDAQGNEVAFTSVSEPGPASSMKSVVSDASLRLIPGEIIDELADEIVKMNTFTKVDEGN